MLLGDVFEMYFVDKSARITGDDFGVILLRKPVQWLHVFDERTIDITGYDFEVVFLWQYVSELFVFESST